MSRRRVRGAGELLALTSRLGKEARGRAKAGSGGNGLPDPAAVRVRQQERAEAYAAAIRRQRSATGDEHPAEQNLRREQLHLPALGAQRRLEARIGQLLGEPRPRARTDLQPLPHGEEVAKNDAMDFRLLARALDGEVDVSAEGAS